MTPAERARQIDKEEFAAECKAVRERAFAYAHQRRRLERRQIEAWLRQGEPAPINLAPMKVAREPVKHRVYGEVRTIDGWAKQLGISAHALLVRRRKLGSLEAAIAMGSGNTRGKRGMLIEFNGETRTVKEWAKHLGVHDATIRERIRSGYTPQAAIALGGRYGKPGVSSNFAPSMGTGAGSTAQEIPNLDFSDKAENA